MTRSQQTRLWLHCSEAGAVWPREAGSEKAGIRNLLCMLPRHVVRERSLALQANYLYALVTV